MLKYATSSGTANSPRKDAIGMDVILALRVGEDQGVRVQAALLRCPPHQSSQKEEGADAPTC